MNEVTIDVDDPEAVAKVLSQFVNRLGDRDSVKKLVDECMRDHRTLIQGKMGFVFLMLAEAARLYKEGYYDLRNEYSFKLASEIWDSMSAGDDGEGGRYHKLKMGVPLI